MTSGSMWRCPRCGQQFVSPNMPHSCEVRDLDELFARSEPGVRSLFDAFLAAARESGPVIVNVTKSRVAFQVRFRFAGVERPRRRHLVATVVLTRPVRSDRFTRVEYIAPYYYVHRFAIRDVADIDAEVRALLAESYRVGQQEHVSNAAWRKVREPPEWVSVPGSGVARGSS